jgi:short-subunit dehydrogenase
LDFRDKVVVVTGASSGIGEATAEAFAKRGAVVVGVARRQERLERLAERCREHSPRSAYLAGDLGEQGFAEEIVAKTVERHGRIDGLVNNAALPKHKLVWRVTAEEARRVLEVNTLSCIWSTLAALPHLRAAGSGFVVNVSSFAGRVVPPREAIYAASKAAMSAFTEGLWLDLEGSGVHALLVIPGAIDTEIWQKLDEPHAFDGRKIPASQVADAILDALAKGRYEITVPKRSPGLLTARFLRFALPGLLRLGMRRMDPIAPDEIESAADGGRKQR